MVLKNNSLVVVLNYHGCLLGYASHERNPVTERVSNFQLIGSQSLADETLAAGAESFQVSLFEVIDGMV